MVAPWQTVADRLSRTILLEHWRVVSEHRVPNRGLHAHTRRASSNDEVSDSQALQFVVQLRFIKTAEAAFVDYRVGRSGLSSLTVSLFQVLRDQDPTFRAVGGTHRRAHVHYLLVNSPIRRAWSAHI